MRKLPTSIPNHLLRCIYMVEYKKTNQVIIQTFILETKSYLEYYSK